MSGKKSEDIDSNIDKELNPDQNQTPDPNQEFAQISEEYEAAYVPNIGALSQLLLLCKGGRTWQEYAGLCKVSPATFTRINKGMISKQVDKGLLFRIYKNQVNPGNPGLDELLKAGGWRKKRKPRENAGEIDPLVEEENIRFDREVREEENRLRRIGGIVRSELDVRGQMTAYYANDFRNMREGRNPLVGELKTRTGAFGIHYFRGCFSRGFTIQVQGMDPKYGVYFPLQATTSLRERDWAHCSDDERDDWLRRILSRIMWEGFSDIFLKDLWEPATLKNIKNTIIFTNRTEFELVGEVLSNKEVKVNNWFSLLLLDMEQEKVVEERFLPRADGKEKEVRSIFETEPIADPLTDEEFLWDDDDSDF